MSGPWRRPSEESHEYPKLCLSDNRQSGSITAGCTRLPLWAFFYDAYMSGWEFANEGYEIEKSSGLTEDEFTNFVYYLLEQRGEFGRLLMILADVERREQTRRGYRAWWETKKDRKRVAAQLRRCLAVVEDA